MLFPYESFLNEIIPVFIPNEILVLVLNFILVSCKLKKIFVADWQSQIVLSGVSSVHISSWRVHHSSENALLSMLGSFIQSCKCVNALRTSLWNETRSGIKFITVSHKQLAPQSWCVQFQMSPDVKKFSQFFIAFLCIWLLGYLQN